MWRCSACTASIRKIQYLHEEQGQFESSTKISTQQKCCLDTPRTDSSLRRITELKFTRKMIRRYFNDNDSGKLTFLKETAHSPEWLRAGTGKLYHPLNFCNFCEVNFWLLHNALFWKVNTRLLKYHTGWNSTVHSYHCTWKRLLVETTKRWANDSQTWQTIP